MDIRLASPRRARKQLIGNADPLSIQSSLQTNGAGLIILLWHESRLPNYES